MLSIYLFSALAVTVAIMIFATKSKYTQLDFSWIVKRNELTDEDIEFNKINYLPILPYLPIIRTFFQFISGATAAGGLVMFFLNRLTFLGFWIKLSIAVCAAVLVAFIFERGILTVCKPFVNTLIRFKFRNRLQLAIFVTLLLLLVIFIGGAVGTSYVSSGESVSTLNENFTSNDVNLNESVSTLLSALNQSSATANKPIDFYAQQRQNERITLSNYYDTKVHADNNWAKKTKVKNYVSSWVSKKAKALKDFDAATSKKLAGFGVTITATTTDNSKSINNVIDQLATTNAAAENRKAERNTFWEYLWISISIVATFITIATIALEQLIVAATTEKKDNTDDTKTDDKTYKPKNEPLAKTKTLTDGEIGHYENAAKGYLVKNIKDVEGGVFISQNAKNNISNWYSRDKGNVNSSNYIKYQYAIKYFAMYNVELKPSPTHANRVIFIDLDTNTEI